MRTVSALFFFALMGTVPAPASAVPPGPVAVTPERSFDAGTVVRGAVIEHSFKVKNAGGATLRITNLESSCNCAAGHYTHLIEPGEEGFVTIRVETDDLSGPTEKSIVAHTSDPEAPKIPFVVTATVDDVILVAPARKASLGVIAREEGAVRKFGLRSADGSPLRITKVEVEEGCVDFEVESAEEGLVAILAVVVPPDFQRVNGSDIIRAKFAVHTDHPRLPLLHLTAHGELRDRLSRAPRDVRFGFVGRKVLDAGDPDAAELWRDISVVYLGEAPLEITSVLAQPDFLRVEPLEKADGPDRVLRVRISPGAPSGPLNGWVKAETNFGTLYWPVTGTIK